MTGVIATLPKFQFSNALGLPMSGGTLTSYLAGTTTLANTYQDQALTAANTNPIALDSRGECTLWLDSTKTYKFVLKNALGVVQWTVDNITNSTAFAQAVRDDLTAFESGVAASSGSSLVGFLPSGTGAVTTTVQSKLRERVSVKDFGAVGDGVTNDAVAIQLAANAISATGGELYFPDGDYVISKRIDFTGNNVSAVLAHNAGILYSTTPDFVAFKLTGARCSVVGGLGRGFIGPASWDGTNVAPTYGVIWFTGDYAYAKTRLFNVKKMGIWFKDVTNGTADGCIIEGNYPSGSYTGVEVGHVGVGFDTSTSNAGDFKLINNTINSCVQGCLPANYGTGGVMQGFVATGNVFNGCFNHGIYTISTNGAVITGNNFNRCQIPIVITGNNNTITGNTMYTSVDTAGNQLDVVGISIRDGSRNVVSGNTIKGVLTVANVACINIQDVSGTGQLNDNVVSNNTINITSGAGSAIRVFGNTNAINRNIIEGNNITCPGNGIGGGAIELFGLAGSVNAGNKVINNSIVLTAQSEGLQANNHTAAEFRGNTIEIAWNSGGATNVYATRWSNTINCNTQNNTLYCRSGNGTNITFYLYREDTAAAGNFLSGNINAVGGSATYAFYVGLAASGLTTNQLGTGAPNFQAKIGSIWIRSDGGVGSTLYIKESGTDASGWIAK